MLKHQIRKWIYHRLVKRRKNPIICCIDWTNGLFALYHLKKFSPPCIHLKEEKIPPLAPYHPCYLKTGKKSVIAPLPSLLSWASSSRELLFTVIYGTFEQRNRSKTIDFFDMALWTKKKFLFGHIVDVRDEPARAGPAMTLFDVLFLNQFRRYKLGILTQVLIPILKLSYKILDQIFILVSKL